VKLIKTLDLLARPRGFELVALGLEMQGIGYTNDIVLHRFVILQYLFYNVLMKNGLKTRFFNLQNWYETGKKGIDLILPSTTRNVEG